GGGLPRHQPAERARFRGTMKVGKRRLERGKALDDRKLSRIALDGAGFNERGVAGPDGRHAFPFVPPPPARVPATLCRKPFPTGLIADRMCPRRSKTGQ